MQHLSTHFYSGKLLLNALVPVLMDSFQPRTLSHNRQIKSLNFRSRNICLGNIYTKTHKNKRNKESWATN